MRVDGEPFRRLRFCSGHADDTLDAAGSERRRGFSHGGAGSENIVHEEHRLPADELGALEREAVCHVCTPLFRARLRGLWWCVACPRESIRENRGAGEQFDLCERPRDEHGLVEPPFPEASRVERNGDDGPVIRRSFGGAAEGWGGRSRAFR